MQIDSEASQTQICKKLQNPNRRICCQNNSLEAFLTIHPWRFKCDLPKNPVMDGLEDMTCHQSHQLKQKSPVWTLVDWPPLHNVEKEHK